jgi:hypothetical protein
MTGLGLIVVGWAVVAIALRRRDVVARIRQLERLESALAEMERAAAAPATKKTRPRKPR